VSADASGKELALGLNVGSMELEYTLASASDSLMTPDFRLRLISPGNFHLAISVGPAGDTCLRTLPGNDAAVFVAEMLGNDSYQLSPGKSVMFGGGKISGAIPAPEMCGCPVSRLDLQTAESTVSPATSAAPVASPEEPAEKKPSEKQTAEAPAPAEPTAVAHMEVDSGFVYRGDDAVQDIYGSVSRLSLSTDNSKLALALLPQVSGPTAKPEAAEKKSGFLHWLGHLFGR
jgi:hypothetical protein